jgi:hypothetical protein
MSTIATVKNIVISWAWWCIPAISTIWEAEVGELWFRQKVSEALSQKAKLDIVANACHPSYVRRGGRKIIQGRLLLHETPS